jgi:hypothetical protein
MQYLFHTAANSSWKMANEKKKKWRSLEMKIERSFWSKKTVLPRTCRKIFNRRKKSKTSRRHTQTFLIQSAFDANTNKASRARLYCGYGDSTHIAAGGSTGSASREVQAAVLTTAQADRGHACTAGEHCGRLISS